MKWLLVLAMISLTLPGCRNGLSDYTLEEKKAIWKKQDRDARKLTMCKKRYKDNPSFLLNCLSSVDDPDLDKLINDPDLKP